MKKEAHSTVSVGQAALEYLMTYGWALVAISAIIGVLILIANPAQNTINCSGFDKFLLKGGKADTEKIQLVIQNASGGKVDGLEVYGGIIYPNADSPPLFQINIGNATVGGTTSSTLSNDYVISFIPGYQTPLGAGIEKRVIVPWPVDGFAGSEFGSDGCDFFTKSLGKQFNVIITVYYRDIFGLVKEETARCTGTIQAASETYFPPSAWGC